MIELDPNEVVVILRALFWEEEKWRNTHKDYRADGEVVKVSKVRQRLSDHLRNVSFTNSLKDYE
jgi:hypothetical protein